MTYYIDIYEFGTLEPIETKGPYTGYRKASKIDDGLNINLNHSRFYTKIRESR